MKKYIGTTIICVLSLAPLLGSAQFKKNIDNPSVKIEVIIEDNTILNEANIQFNMFRNDINTDYNANTETIIHKVTTHDTTLTIPLTSALNYGRIHFDYKNQSQPAQPFNQDNNLFLFQAGDKIKLYLSKNKAVFKGVGSEKYDCAYELSKHQDIETRHFKLRNNYLKKADYEMYFRANKHYADSLYIIKTGILSSYRPYLKVDVYNLMLADCWADYNAKIVTGIFSHTLSFTKRLGNAHLSSVMAAYENYLSTFSNAFLPDSVLARSLKYCDYLYTKEYHAKQAFAPSDSTSVSSFLYRYYSIKKSYTGLVKEKVMLVNFYSGNIKSEDLDLVRKDAVNSSSSPVFKKELIRLIGSKIGKAFAFELPDKEGKIYRLSDFKGKLIVIDFWYTGCVNCIVMAKRLKPIIKDLKSKPEVVFISISIDGDRYRNYWLKSLEDETYSSKEELNLLAQGKTAEIIKHYNIIGYPTLLVISKEGKVVTLLPPDPRANAQKFKDFLVDNL